MSQSNDDFTIAALPDTQFYSKSYPQIFDSETQWIADNAVAMNIKLVIGLGDIVDGGGSLTQWQNADAAYQAIDRAVPFMPAIGNHDYDRNNPPGRTASATNYNSFFGPSRFNDRSWYKGNFPAGSNENFYGIFSFGSHNYLVVVLEVFPRDSALRWAASVIQSHPSYDVIVVTHAYTYADNTRLDHCDENSAASFGAGQDNDGEQIWEKLVSKYPNIVMVLSGHVVEGDGTGRRADFGDNGNLVNQMLSDYQSYANGGNGYIRLITVRPFANVIEVKTYSPYLNRYMTDSHNQFTMTYKNTGHLTSARGSISGLVKNAADCTKMSNVGVSASAGSGTTGTDGQFAISASGPTAYNLNVSRSGYGVAKPRNRGSGAVPTIAIQNISFDGGNAAGQGDLKWQPGSECRSAGFWRSLAHLEDRNHRAGRKLQRRLDAGRQVSDHRNTARRFYRPELGDRADRSGQRDELGKLRSDCSADELGAQIFGKLLADILGQAIVQGSRTCTSDFHHHHWSGSRHRD